MSGFFAISFDENGKGWFCLLSPACFTMSINPLVQYETSTIGLQWSNIHDVYDDFAFGTSIIMFYVDYIIYMLLALYLDNVWPSRYGSHKVAWFCFLPSFWRGKTANNDSAIEEELQLFWDKSKENEENMHNGKSTFEKISVKYTNTQRSISIRKLVKYYQTNLGEFGASGIVKAVNGISLDI